MNIIFIGAPGTGKGTLAAKIAAEHSFTHLAPGNMLRDEVKNTSQLGKKIKSLIESGTLVPDDIVNKLIEKNLKKNNIFDGYPRTLAQAEALDKLVKVDSIILFEMSEEQIVKRLSGRRTCPHCQAVYHTITLKPKKENTCDKCGSQLTQRKDDSPDVVTHRFREFNEKTAPLIEFYKKRKILHTIDGGKDVETVYQNIKKVLKL